MDIIRSTSVCLPYIDAYGVQSILLQVLAQKLCLDKDPAKVDHWGGGSEHRVSEILGGSGSEDETPDRPDGELTDDSVRWNETNRSVGESDLLEL